jgi:VCBS repeat-containing protein
VAQPAAASVAEGGTLTGALTANDRDLPNDTLAFAVVTGPAHGTLVLNPDGTGSYTHDGSENFADSFVYKVTDAKGASSQATVTLTITPVNDNTPVAQAGSASVAEGGTVAGTLTASDADLPNDALRFTLLTGPTQGSLTLNANGSYSYTHDGSENFADSFIYTVTDGQGASSQASVTLTVTPVNDNAPVAQAGAATAAEGGTLAGNVVVSDADQPNDTLTVALATGPAHGTLTLNPNGSYSYTHDGTENFADSFVYTVSDAQGASSQATMTLTITPLNDNAPVAQPGSGSVAEGGTVAGTVVATDTDLPNDTLTFTLVTAPARGTLSLNANGSYTYTHDGSENFLDTFVYKVTDAQGASSQATVTLTITPVNDNPPLTRPGWVSVAEGGTVARSVTARDADLPNDALSFALVTGPAQGALTLNSNGSYSYTHNGTENFTDSFVYKVTDAQGASNQATVTLTITPINDNAPLAQAAAASVAEGATVASSVAVSDVDQPNDTLTVTLVTGTAHGSLALDANGSYSYTHDGSENFSDSFIYEVRDAKGAVSQSSVSITINPRDDPTVPAADDQTVGEDSSANGNVLTNDRDPDDTLQVASFTIAGDPVVYNAGQSVTLAGIGSFTLAPDGNYAFAPVADWNGSVPVVSYTTNTNAVSTLALKLTAVNDAPVRTSGPIADATVAEGSGGSIGLGSLAYSPGGGSDESTQLIAVRATRLPDAALGRLVLADGTVVALGTSYTLAQWQGLRFLPAAGVNTGSGDLRFSFSDGIATVAGESIRIRVVNEAPVLAGANALPDVPEDAATHPGMSVSDLLAGQASDAGAVRGIAVVSAVNADGEWQFSRDGGANWSSLAAASSTQSELLVADGQARVRFVPRHDWNGTASGLVFRAWDGTGGTASLLAADTRGNGGSAPFSSATANASLTVLPVNDAPVPLASGPSSIAISQDDLAPSLGLSPWSFGAGGGGDEAGQALTITIAAAPTQLGTLQLADGTAVRNGDSLTVAQFQGLRLAPSGSSGGLSGDLQWTVRDSGGTARGGVDQVAGSVRIAITPAAAAPAPAPAPVPAPPPPVSAAPAPTPAPAPAPAAELAAPAAPRPAAGAAAGVEEALLSTPGSTGQQGGPESGFTSERRGLEVDAGRPVFIRTLQDRGEIQLVGYSTPAEFQVLGFSNLERSTSRAAVEDLRQMLRSGAFVDELNRVREQMRQDFNLDRTTSITVAGLSLGVSVVYILWLIRGGVLLGSYLSALPAWRLLDPLPVLARAGEEEDEEDEEPLHQARVPADPLRGFA